MTTNYRTGCPSPNPQQENTNERKARHSMPATTIGPQEAMQHFMRATFPTAKCKAVFADGANLMAVIDFEEQTDG